MTEKTPHPAAGASTLSPRRGPGNEASADIAKSALSAPTMNGHPEEPGHGGATKEPGISNTAMGSGTRKTKNTGILRSAQDDRGRAQDDGLRVQDDGQRGQDDSDAALALTSSGARKVEAALLELHACRAQSGIEAQQIATCQARAEADEAEVKRLKVSVGGLNRALDAKDKILALQQSESQAELRAARGTFLGRLARWPGTWPSAWPWAWRLEWR